MAYYNPYIIGFYNPLYNTTNQGFFHCSYIYIYNISLQIGSMGLVYSPTWMVMVNLDGKFYRRLPAGSVMGGV